MAWCYGLFSQILLNSISSQATFVPLNAILYYVAFSQGGISDFGHDAWYRMSNTVMIKICQRILVCKANNYKGKYMQRLTNKMRGLSTCGQDDNTHLGQAMIKRKLLFKEILRTLEPMVTVIRSRVEYTRQSCRQQFCPIPALIANRHVG